jgi:predicted DNA-binding transcriptional regulator YafY
MADSLPDSMSFNFADWDRSISFRTSAEPILNLDIFNRLAKAAADHKQMVLSYRKPASKGVEERLIDPYHLANINGEWYLYAWCHLRKDIRTFVPARIIAVKLTGKTFKRPADFSIDKLLCDSFGVMTGKDTFAVSIRFDELVADYIREKIWHPSQTLIELPNGEIELRLKLSSLVEISRWILGWGGRAVVLHPPALAVIVKESARFILDSQSS